MKILFATNFKKAAPEELSSVISIAKRFDAEVYLLHVMTDLFRDWMKSGMVEMRAEERLDKWAEQLKDQEVKVEEWYVMKGNAADTIVQAGDAVGAELIIVGAEKKSTIQRFLEGTTAETVVRHAKASVLINKKYAHDDPERILCAIDDSNQAPLIVDKAASWAKAYQAPLKIIHIVQLPAGNPLGLDEDELEEKYDEFRAQQKGKIKDLLKSVDLSAIDSEIELRWGTPHEVVTNKIEDEEYELLIIGATGRSTLSYITLGSTANKLIRSVQCPVLVVKQQVREEEE